MSIICNLQYNEQILIFETWIQLNSLIFIYLIFLSYQKIGYFSI